MFFSEFSKIMKINFKILKIFNILGNSEKCCFFFFFAESSNIKLNSVTDIEQHMVGLSHSYSVFMVKVNISNIVLIGQLRSHTTVQIV